MEHVEQPFVVFMPGAVTPAALSYASLLEQMKDRIVPILKDLELYATAAPPEDYGLEMEVEGIRRAADEHGAAQFHLVGFSAGGAVSLAFTARYPERLLSLALIEPAWIGNKGRTTEDAADWAELEQAMKLEGEERMRAFTRWHMRPGVEPPAPSRPPGPPPFWMAQRPAGLEALIDAFEGYQLTHERFRSFEPPVYHAVGSLSRAIFERNARTLGRFFPNYRIDIYEGRSHFDPPHRAEPERFAQALFELFARAGEGLYLHT